MKLRALIVDDEAPARRKIRHFLEAHTDIEIAGECENGQDAVAQVRACKPDILFLDIQMPLLDGFSVLKRSRGGHGPAVVFITAYDEFAVRAFEASAVDYLLKPFTRKRFEEALQKVKQHILLRRDREPAARAMEILQQLRRKEEYLQRLAVRSGERIFFLPCERIDWMESEGNYIMVHAGKETHVLRESMNALQRSLDPDAFLRVHRRILVQAARIVELHPGPRTRLVLQDGTMLPVSRRLKDRVRRFLLKQND